MEGGAVGHNFSKLWLDGPLPKLYPVISISNQDGHQAKNRKKLQLHSKE
jgi:hypothetical protein